MLFLVMESIRTNLIHTSKGPPSLYAPWMVSKQSVKFQKTINHVRALIFTWFLVILSSWKLLHCIPNYCRLAVEWSRAGQSSICPPNTVLNGFP